MSVFNIEIDFSEVEQIRSHFQELTKYKLEAAMNVSAEELATKVNASAKYNTPVRSGTLKRGWEVKPAESVSRVHFAKVQNSVEYAPYVEYGHKTRNGGFVPGQFILTKAVERNEKLLPGIAKKYIFSAISGEAPKTRNRKTKSNSEESAE